MEKITPRHSCSARWNATPARIRPAPSAFLSSQHLRIHGSCIARISGTHPDQRPPARDACARIRQSTAAALPAVLNAEGTMTAEIFPRSTVHVPLMSEALAPTRSAARFFTARSRCARKDKSVILFPLRQCLVMRPCAPTPVRDRRTPRRSR